MISNNTKKLSTAAVFLAAMFVVGFFVSVQGDNDPEVRGITIFEPKSTQTETADRTRLNELEDEFNKAETDKERERIITEASIHLRESAPPTNLKRMTQYTEAVNRLTTAVNNMPKQEDGHAAIPFTRMGYSEQDEMLVVRIHQDFSTLDNMKRYELIRDVIGKELDLKIVDGGDYWRLSECPNCPL